MNIKNNFSASSIVLKSHVNRYAILGFIIALSSILVASLIVSYQLTGYVTLYGFIQAQKLNPVIWIMDLTPFLFAYWGQAFCIGLVNRAETLMGEKTKEFISINNELESKLMHESHYDSLTNLPNARTLSKQVERAINVSGRHNEVAIIVLKMNDLSSINYNFGTFNANNVLKQFAEKLNSILIHPYMLQETAGINTVARVQAEEFVLLLPKISKSTNIDELVSMLLKLVAVNFMIDGIHINMTTTAGVAIFPQHGLTEEVLLNHANIAVYHARKEGKPYVIYNSEMEDVTQNRIMMNELKRAIEGNELDIYYQPIVELETGKIVGAEALVRFDHPEYGLLSAEKFIPLIEGTGLIQPLTAFMLHGAIQQLAMWHEQGHFIFVSVNLSVKDTADRELPIMVEKLLEKYKILSKFLKLEFTERSCLSDQVATKEVLEQLSSMGVKLSIDDFCSGYSSFTYLMNYPIDDIKIEKSHVLKMSKDPKKDKIVEAVIKLSEILGVEAIADGVADKTTRTRLLALGCRYGQGFYFSRAISVEDFDDLLNKK